MATTLGPMADWRLYKIAHDAWHAEALRPRRLPFLASRGSNRPHHRRVTTLAPSPMILTSGHPREHGGELPPLVGYMPKPWQPLNVLIAAERA